MTFDPFGDFETRGYLRNHFELRDRRQLAQVEFNNYRTVLPEALAYLEGSDLSYEDVLQVHRILFEAIYPWAGDDRSVTAPNIAVTRGGYDDLFCHPVECRRVGEYALRDAGRPEIYLVAPGDAYSHLCHSHPFLDGNGRTLLLVHSEMLRRASAHIVWENVSPDDFLRTLTEDLRSPNQGVLDNFLLPYLVRTPRSRDDLQATLVDQILIHGIHTQG